MRALHIFLPHNPGESFAIAVRDLLGLVTAVKVLVLLGHQGKCGRS